LKEWLNKPNGVNKMEQEQAVVGKLIFFVGLAGFSLGIGGYAVFQLYAESGLSTAETGILLGVTSVLATASAFLGKNAQDQLRQHLEE
jgi:drug/metabolite transporter (DMT)-like permease